MNKLKVATIVGTRPEIIKLSETIKRLDENFDHVLAHTGQNYDYELNEIFFTGMGIRRPDVFLECAGASAAGTIAAVIEKSDQFLREAKPDALLIYGDTNSCLCVISAKRLKIPIFHMEAGNRCFDQRVPEEINRKIVDHLSDVNMVHSEHARKYLESEGISSHQTFLTGTPMHEILKVHAEEIENSDALARLGVEKGGYFVVSLHREENVDSQENLTTIVNSLNAVAKTFSKKVVLSLHPRTRKRLEEMPDLSFGPEVIVQKPLGFADYVSLQKNSFCTLSDSGTITEESSLLGFPAIMVRETHERPEGMDVGSVVMSGLDQRSIENSINIAVNLSESRMPIANYSNDYVSSQVVKIIQSYCGYINRTTWKKK